MLQDVLNLSTPLKFGPLLTSQHIQSTTPTNLGSKLSSTENTSTEPVYIPTELANAIIKNSDLSIKSGLGSSNKAESDISNNKGQRQSGPDEYTNDVKKPSIKEARPDDTRIPVIVGDHDAVKENTTLLSNTDDHDDKMTVPEIVSSNNSSILATTSDHDGDADDSFMSNTKIGLNSDHSNKTKNAKDEKFKTNSTDYVDFAIAEDITIKTKINDNSEVKYNKILNFPKDVEKPHKILDTTSIASIVDDTISDKKELQAALDEIYRCNCSTNVYPNNFSSSSDNNVSTQNVDPRLHQKTIQIGDHGLGHYLLGNPIIPLSMLEVLSGTFVAL